MYSTALSVYLPDVPDEQHASRLGVPGCSACMKCLLPCLTPVPSRTTLLSAHLPDGCLAGSLQLAGAVGQWYRDQQLPLGRLFGPRDFYTPASSLYRLQ